MYQDAFLSSPHLGQSRSQLWVNSKSPFSDHMNYMQLKFENRTEALNGLPRVPLSATLALLAEWAILASVWSVFHPVSRQHGMLCHAKTTV